VIVLEVFLLHVQSVMIWRFVLLTNRVVEGLKFAITSDPVIDCNGTDIVIDISTGSSDLNSYCHSTILELNSDEPFSTFGFTNSVYFVLLDVEAGITEFPDFSDAVPEMMRVLVTAGEWSPPDNWLIDHHLLASPVGEARVYDTREMGIKRSVELVFGYCESGQGKPNISLLPPPLLSAGVSIRAVLGDTVGFCLISIDGRIAHFDSQIEWLQASLAEAPCRQSDFVIVSFSGDVDNGVVDLIESHALVDLVFSEKQGFGWNPWDNRRIEFSPNGEFRIFDSCESDESVPFVESKKSQRLMDYPSPAVFSTTESSNVIVSLIVAVASGISLNIAFRRSLLKSSYSVVSGP